MRSLLNYETKVLNESAEWVIFIHGAGGSIKTWTRQVADFETHYNLLFIDLRDHDESKNMEPAYQKYNFQIVSSDIKAVLDKLSIEQAHFITLSFGSVLLQDFASRYPEMIEKVVFVGGIFNGGIFVRGFVYLARFLNTFLPYPLMYRIFSYILMPRKRNQFARRLYQTQALKITQREYMKWLGLYREFFQLLSNFSQQALSFPSLIIMGSMDFVFLKSAHAFAKKQTSTILQEIPGAGHIANIEEANTFNKISLEFLDS